MITRLFMLMLLILPASATAGQVKLLMFEEAGCVWCEQWNSEISSIYPKTQEGRTAPLQRIDIHSRLPDGITLNSQPVYTPTFVVVDDGHEIGRIEGYPGQDFFWGLLGQILKPLPEYTNAKGAS
ncbi:MAG: hypothetical protein IME92_03540 [Proteobacteria bacterium]|nr:hypothetical protein [Pseudomonadota bacterium]